MTSVLKTSSRISLALGLAVAGFASTGHAGDKATADEAVAMVAKGRAFLAANGKEKGFEAISEKGGRFSDRDLYLVVYGLDGVVHAHGANRKMIGKNLIALKDIDGKEFVRERVELGKAKPSFWQDYKFTNPVSRKVEPKKMYCERFEDAVVCGGIYVQ
ncbi:MAG: cache domain-containing protein [Lautropia sp.]